MRIVISILQMWGGLCGFLISYNMSILFGPPESIAPLFVQLMSILSFVAGVALWAKPRIGLPLSILTQVPQTISFAVWRLTYAFALGPAWGIEVGYNSSGHHFIAPVSRFELFQPQLILRTSLGYAGFGLVVNLVALSAWHAFCGKSFTRRDAPRPDYSDFSAVRPVNLPESVIPILTATVQGPVVARNLPLEIWKSPDHRTWVDAFIELGTNLYQSDIPEDGLPP